MKKRVHTMITGFRDGFQSVFGARVLTKDFLPAVEATVAAGLNHFEAGGGARFQSLYFYCNEDAFDMMDQFRAAAGPEANLQTLARGTNVVGLESQSRDIINLHAKLFKKHGITTIRNFDALNDVNNLIYSGQCIHDAGAKHEVCVTMMALPPGVTGAHDPEFYIGVLKKILDAGIPYDSVCFKDASGTSTPAIVHETIKKARQLLGEDVHIVFHTHETAGISIQQYISALEAGANQVDCSMAPVSGGTCQPDVMTLWHALRGTDFDLGIDINKLIEAEEVFKDCMADYFVPPEAKAVEPRIPFSPMPGGALTANTQMMRDNGILNRYSEVIDAMGEVVVRGGFGTSVTPVSQFYFQQAFNNVMFGPWKKIADGYGKMVLGYFGKTPVEPDQEIVKLCQEQMKLDPTDRVPVDINDEDPTKGVEAANKLLAEANLPITEENTFIAATCKEKGIQFLKGEAKVGVRKKEKEAAPAAAPTPAAAPAAPASKPLPESYKVNVNGSLYDVKLKDGVAIVNDVAYAIDIAEGAPGTAQPIAAPVTAAPAPKAAAIAEKPAATEKPAAPAPAIKASGTAHEVEAPLPGLILRIAAKVGATVAEGETILVVESMKMETEIHAPIGGILSDIRVGQGDQVQAGDILAVIHA
ncbi:MAG: biotin attachment protein [Spirochaetales bacterium]|jgi:pyruvate carboxylase subunit B|nr:biotin attachment protein [Spirochaetales bacterium]